MQDKVIKVVAGVIQRDENQVLLSQRLPGTHLEGLWEFPGGKIEQGETPKQALSRELNEELGIDIVTSVPLMIVRHQYPDKNIELHIREVMGWENEIAAREKQPLQWIGIDKLHEIKMPAADKPAITALKLPRVYQITPECKDVAAYLEFIRKALKNRSKFIQIRAKNLSSKSLQDLISKVNTLKHRNRAIISVNSGNEGRDISTAGALDGLHLSSSHLTALTTRPAELNGFLFASCHNSEEIRQAEEIAVDMICLSPLYATDSHPGSKLLGEDAFAKLVASTNLPVYALGGIQPEHMAKLRELGAAGIAGINAFERW